MISESAAGVHTIRLRRNRIKNAMLIKCMWCGAAAAAATCRCGFLPPSSLSLSRSSAPSHSTFFSWFCCSSPLLSSPVLHIFITPFILHDKSALSSCRLSLNLYLEPPNTKMVSYYQCKFFGWIVHQVICGNHHSCRPFGGQTSNSLLFPG